MFQFNIGPAIKVYHFIVFLYLPRIIYFYKNNTIIKRKTKPLIAEFIIMMLMGLLFSFVLPFDDPFRRFRNVTQLAEWRTLISGGRLFLELFSIILVIYWLKVKVFSIHYLFNVISISSIITVLLAFLIFATKGVGYKILFPYWDYVTDRMQYMYNFRGLVGEPKTFGRTCAFLLISNLYFGKYISKRIRLIAISLSLVGILASLSASAIIVTSVGLLLFFISQRNIRNAFILCIAILGVTITYKYSIIFNNVTLGKIQYVLSSNNKIERGKVKQNEPELFARFEIFDRAALNFLYYNPQYLLFGVGPNTVSIPASQYLTYRMAKSQVFGYGLNTGPTTLFVNILSRSGLFGLSLYLFFILSVFMGLRVKRDKNVFVILTIMAFITNTALISLFYSIFLYLSIEYRKDNSKKNNIVTQNSIKR